MVGLVSSFGQALQIVFHFMRVRRDTAVVATHRPRTHFLEGIPARSAAITATSAVPAMCVQSLRINAPSVSRANGDAAQEFQCARE
jgi:hypothetical protein